ncbi:MAG: hypothetical protein R3E67_02340 [Pseudomonadales bacterium]
MADALRQWQMQGGNTSFLIGGPDDSRLPAWRAQDSWSLSQLNSCRIHWCALRVGRAAVPCVVAAQQSPLTIAD